MNTSLLLPAKTPAADTSSARPWRYC